MHMKQRGPYSRFRLRGDIITKHLGPNLQKIYGNLEKSPAPKNVLLAFALISVMINLWYSWGTDYGYEIPKSRS